MLVIPGKLFDSMIYVYTEGQNWDAVVNLMSWVTRENCEPMQSTIKYLKKNLLYCFETQVRAQLKERMEQFELEFFVGNKNRNY